MNPPLSTTVPPTARHSAAAIRATDGSHPRARDEVQLRRVSRVRSSSGSGGIQVTWYAPGPELAPVQPRQRDRHLARAPGPHGDRPVVLERRGDGERRRPAVRVGLLRVRDVRRADAGADHRRPDQRQRVLRRQRRAATRGSGRRRRPGPARRAAPGRRGRCCPATRRAAAAIQPNTRSRDARGSAGPARTGRRLRRDEAGRLRLGATDLDRPLERRGAVQPQEPGDGVGDDGGDAPEPRPVIGRAFAASPALTGVARPRGVGEPGARQDDDVRAAGHDEDVPAVQIPGEVDQRQAHGGGPYTGCVAGG